MLIKRKYHIQKSSISVLISFFVNVFLIRVVGAIANCEQKEFVADKGEIFVLLNNYICILTICVSMISLCVSGFGYVATVNCSRKIVVATPYGRKEGGKQKLNVFENGNW